MPLIKGIIHKIIKYKNPVSFTVKDENDDGSKTLKNIQYDGFLPVREGDVCYCKCVEEDSFHYPTFKPLVIIPSTEENIKNCIFKSLRQRKIGEYKRDKFYEELAKLCGKDDDEKENISFDNSLSSDDLSSLDNSLSNEEEIIKFLDQSCIKQEIKFHSLTRSESDLFLEWWKNNHLFRRLYLFGLNKKEIRESGLSPEKLYEKLKRNPFKVSSISLIKAGEIYKMFGKTPTEEDIYCGGLLRGMEKMMSYGSLACYKNKIQKQFPRYDKFEKTLIEEYDVLVKDNLLYTKYTYEIETIVAREITRRLIEEDKLEKRLDKLGINIMDDSPYHVHAEPNFVLTKEQESALFGCLNSHISIITGGAGCGKTTLIKQLVKNLEKNGESFMLTSLTGKAVLRMREVIGLSDDYALTMHRLIYNFNRIKKFYHLIIDEASMIPTELMYEFFDAFPHYYKITLVGDPNQLTPIGKGRLFLDLLKFSPPDNDKVLSGCEKKNNCAKIKHFRLTVNKRFADNSILTNSNGLVDENRDRKIPYKFISGDGLYIVKGDLSVCNKIITGLHKKNISPDRITMLTPANKDIPQMVDYFRESYLEGKKKYHVGEKTFYISDRVMQNRNVYLDNTYDIMNGEEGKITIISSENITVDYGNEKIIKYNYIESEIKDENEEIEEEKLSIKDIKVSFAKTIHRSQGSEYDFVVLYIPEGMDNFININMLYTGITRAKKSIWIVTNEKTLSNCTINYLRDVPGSLEEKIKNLLTDYLTLTGGVTVPVIPSEALPEGK